MERDFMGLSSKESLVMVKEEVNDDLFKDSGYAKNSVAQWPFSNKVSALPHYLSFKVGQEDKMRKNISEHHFSSGVWPICSVDAVEQSQKHAMLEFQKFRNQDRQQGGPHFTMAAYPVQHDMYPAKMFPVLPNQQGVAVPFLKQQLLGGIPAPSQNTVLPTACSIAGLTEPWNNSKPSGSPAQLTIFYAGTVNVYDGISPEKARAIMFLAGSSSMASNAANLKSQVLVPTTKLGAGDGIPMSQPLNTPNTALSSPSSVSSHAGTQSGSGSTSTDELMLAKPTGVVPATPVSKVEQPKMMNPAAAMLPSAVPQARKASLARFLEKRKERMMNSAPYNFCKNSSECTASESNGANFAASPAVDCLQ